MKTCSTCNETKDRSEFPSSGWHTRNDGSKVRLHKPQCKLCFNRHAKTQPVLFAERAGIVFKCTRCGYDKCRNALEFHHKDPTQKEFTLAQRWSVSYENFLAEVTKCVILCANCHRELHAGLWSL